MYVYKTVPTNISNNKSLIVNNPFDISVPYDKKKSRESTCLKFGIDPSCFLLGYIGRLVSWKNIDTILYSLCEILSSTSYKANIHLIIAGDGDLEYRQLLTSIIKSNGLEKHVTFVGFVDDAPYILSAIDLLIASSINEPFGRVLVESILQKTLVLASNSGAHGDIIEHNKSGVLFEVSSIESLSRHILDIINNKDKHDHIIDFAYKNAINIYPSSMHADSIVKIYKHLIKDKG
jgi:glycosyltransferase involved in cell wall biosynthesis